MSYHYDRQGSGTRADRARRFLLDFATIVLTVLILNCSTGQAQSNDTSTSVQQPTPWYLNNVLSTSLRTPAAAVKIPLDETVAVHGTIIDVDGTPAVEAEVWAASLFCEPPLREKVLTDDQGHFVLHLKPLRGKSERWSLSAYKGTAGASIDGSQAWIAQPNPTQPKPIVARLIARGMFHCNILASENGTPIQDARMYMGDGRVMISDSEGRIDIGGLKQGSHPIVVLAAGRERRRVLFDNTRQPDGNLNITLDPAGRIEGHVVDEQDRPVPRAWVKVFGSGRALTLDGRCAVANEQGEFAWDGVRLHHVLRAIDAGADGFETAELNSLVVQRDEPTKVVFRLKRNESPVTRVAAATEQSSESPPNDQRQRNATAKSATLSNRDVQGIVTDPQGNRVGDALVRWGATQYENVSREHRTGADGTFVLSEVPDRDGYVTVIADVYAPMFVPVRKGQIQLDVKLSNGTSIGGQVVNQLGDPVRGASIIPVIASPDPSLCNPFWISERSGKSDEDGWFLLEGLPKAGVAIDVLHPEMSELRNQSVRLGELNHVMKLQSRGVFRGRVLDAAGKPVTDFRVSIDFPRDREPSDRLEGFSVVYRGIGISYTNWEGRFCWGDEITPGATYRVTVSAKGHGDSSIDRIVATYVDLLDDAEEHVFRLSEPKDLSVKVVDSRTDQPVTGARVTLINDRPELDHARFSWANDVVRGRFYTTDENGIADCNALSFGAATVVVQAEGYAYERFGWRQSETDLTARLAPEAVITGTVRTDSGAPLNGLSVSLQGDDETSHWRPLEDDAKGQFRIGGLGNQRYTLDVYEQRETIYHSIIQTKPGETVDLTLTIDPDSRKVTNAKIQM